MQDRVERERQRERERARERERGREREREKASEREREKERERVCVCVCARNRAGEVMQDRERETERGISLYLNKVFIRQLVNEKLKKETQTALERSRERNEGEIIGLFCKRALKKRLYCTKGTYNLIEK